MIKLFTLGSLDLVDPTDGHQILSVLAQPKRVGFLTYLALASPRGTHQRDTLLGIFWPDSTDKKARNALNQTVFVLRRALGQNVFSINGEPRIAVDPEELWCDAWEFERTLEAGEIEEALELYKGSFLEGFFLPGCLGFERWVDSERSRLRDLAIGAVLSLSKKMEGVGNPVGAVGWLRRGREWAPYDEVVLRRQMELLLALGDRSGAVREFESFARRLSVDLGLEPSQEARHLLDHPVRPRVDWPLPGSDPEAEPVPMGRTPEPIGDGGRRFSLPQATAIAVLAAILGIGGGHIVPGFWTKAASEEGPMPVQAELRRNVAVLPFENATADPTMDPLGQMVADEIVQELANTGVASVGPVVGSAEGVVVGRGQVRALSTVPRNHWAIRDAAFVITGSFWDQGEDLVFRTRILDVTSNEIVAAMDSIVGSAADPSDATQRLKGRVAGTLAMIFDSRLSDLVPVASHPPSLEAYQLVSDGLDFMTRDRTPSPDGQFPWLQASVDAFLEAASLDSQFTLALILALNSSERLGYRIFSDLSVLEARREQLPRWERAMLEYHLAGIAFDMSRQYEAVRRIVGITPTRAWTLRLASLAFFENRPKEALELIASLESVGDQSGDREPPPITVIDSKMALGDWEDSLEGIIQALAQNDQGHALYAREVEVLARLGRRDDAVEKSIRYLETTGNPEAHDLWIWFPQILRGVGLPDEARQVAEWSVAKLRGMDRSRPYVFQRALVMAGYYDEAREELLRIAEIEDNRHLGYAALAYIAAREGHAEEAIRFSERARSVAEASGPQNTRWGVMSQVEVAAQLGDAGGAVRFLREAFEQGIPKGSWVLTRWDLTPLYGYQPFEDLISPKG